jgi:erythromycin esterase-like protein
MSLEPIPERANWRNLPSGIRIGSHYFHAQLSEQFDAVIHFEQTRAVEPLQRIGEWEVGEPAETFPSGV